jgi:hypothetical protein
MSDTTSEFVQKLMTLVAKTGTGQVQSDAVSKLVNGFVRSIGVEKKAKKEAKKNGKKEKSDTDKPDNVYILYCREKRKSITDLPENKGKRPEEITCLLADEWRKERAQNSSFIKGLQEKADEASLKYKKVKEEARAKEKAKAKEEKAKAKEKAKEEKAKEKEKEEEKDEKEPSTPLKKEKAPKVPNAPKKKKVEKNKDENEEKAENASKKKTALDFSEQ